MKKSLLLSSLGILAAYSAYAVIRKINEFKLEGKTVLITGSSHGLGYVLAKVFLEEKCNVIICGRDEKLLDLSYKNLLGKSNNVTAFKCDVTKRDEVKNLVNKAIEVYGSVDVLVNNAGIIHVGPFENMSVQDFEDAMKVHFWAPLYTTLEVLDYMKKRKSGRIVNISSIGGKVHVPHLLPYVASKFALTGFSNALGTELKKYGIKVTTINPGLMRTGSARHIITKGSHEKEYANFSTISTLPLITVSAEYAARRIVNALKNGESDVIISLPAKLLALFQFSFPDMYTNIVSLVNNMLLPSATGSRTSKTGFESVSELTPSFVRSRYEKYELLYNQPRSKK